MSWEEWAEYCAKGSRGTVIMEAESRKVIADMSRGEQEAGGPKRRTGR